MGSKTMGLRAISSPPAQCPAYAIAGFMSAEECTVLRRLAEKQRASGRLGLGCQADDASLREDERAALAAFEQRVAAITGCAPHDSDGKAVFKFSCSATGSTDVEEEDEDQGTLTAEQQACRLPGLPMGLHVDTHNQQSRRFASVILYLNTLPPGTGGETVFPNDKTRGEELLQAHLTHTHTASRPGGDPRAQRAAAALLATAQGVCCCDSTAHPPSLEASASSALRSDGRALAVCPREGQCLLFYTRHPATGGHIDALSWHGGARVGGAENGKWILQKFKAVPLPRGVRRLEETGIAQWVCRHVSLPQAGCLDLGSPPAAERRGPCLADTTAQANCR